MTLFLRHSLTPTLDPECGHVPTSCAIRELPRLYAVGVDPDSGDAPLYFEHRLETLRGSNNHDRISAVFVTAEVGNQTRDAGAAAREMQRYGIGLKYLNECTLLHLRMARLRRRCGEGPREAGRPHERRAESYSRTPPGVKVHERNVLRSDGPRPMHRARFRVFRATTIVVGLITVRPCRSAPIAVLKFTYALIRTHRNTIPAGTSVEHSVRP